MTLKEATVLALKVLKEVMEEKLNSTNIEVASVIPVSLLPSSFIFSPACFAQSLFSFLFFNFFRRAATNFTQKRSSTSCCPFCDNDTIKKWILVLHPYFHSKKKQERKKDIKKPKKKL